MKKFVAVILVLMMALCSLSAAAQDAFVPAQTYDAGERAYFGGSITLEAAPVGGGSITTVPYAGIEGKDYTDEKMYTYNGYTNNITSETDWNPHTWYTNEDSSLLEMMTVPLYDFVLNSDMTGYSIVPEMAAGYPVDVTAEYVGCFGVEEGESAKAWRITLNEDACWENGEKITADDYIYSMEQLFNPKMLNLRADTYYDGKFSIVGAKAYLYSAQAGQTGFETFSYSSMQDALDAEADLYINMWDTWGLQGCVDAEGNECPKYVSIHDEVKYRDIAIEDETSASAWVSASDIFGGFFAPGCPYESEAKTYMAQGYTIEGGSWEEVGIQKVDEYTFDIIIEQPIAEAEFYVPYSLQENWLVNEELYEACKTRYDAQGNVVETDEEAVSIISNYCTSKETSIGYGPYRLESYELDKQYTFVRNENWYGYSDGKHLGQYQTDRYVVHMYAQHTSAMMAFEKGEIDTVDLAAEDMAKYASSSYIRYIPLSATTKFTFNTDYEKLLSHGTNSQVLVIDEFREGISLSIDRYEFATAYTAAGTAGYGLLNYMYVYDPFTGASYRDSESAKAALVGHYGLTWGEGGEYETLDDAYAAMTGYDMDAAREMMKIAAQKAIDAGIWDGVSPIVIEMRVLAGDTELVQRVNYLEQQVVKACEGTAFEGLVSIEMVIDPDYYETNYSGGTDAIFTTWGGEHMEPFGAFYSCYCDGAYGTGKQMEYGFDTNAVVVTFEVDGVEMVATLSEWAQWCNSAKVDGITDKIGNFTDYSYETRCAFAAGVESGLMKYYTTIPLFYINEAVLVSQKVDMASDEYIQLAEFGGIQFCTYNYDDAQWADYCAGNTLAY